MPRVSPGTRRTTTEVLEPLPQAAPVDPREIPAAPEDQTFWDWMQGTTAEDWEKKRYSCYLYRLEPPAGKVTGEPAYITKYVRPFTLEEVQADFGGGKYMYWVKEGGTKQLYRSTFRIAGDPRTDVAKVGATDAAGLTPVLRIFADEINKRRDSGADATTATKQAMEILTTAYKTGLETVGKGSEPTKLTELISAIAQMKNLSGDSNSEIMKLLLQKALNPPNPMESIKPLLEFAKEFMGGGEGGARGDWRVSLAQNIPSAMQHLKEIAHEFAVASQANALAAQRTLIPQPPRPAAGVGAMPPPGADAPMPVSTPGGPLPLDPLNATPEVPGDAMPNPSVTPDHQTWLKQMIVQKVLQGWTGEDLHGWLLDTAPEVIEELKAHSVDQILFYFGSDPTLRLAPQGAPLRKVIEDFLKFAKEEEPPKPN